ncbi:MAG: hypothetical protein CMC13_05965 [Flavobacteriaceae bacterium]|nr:hypothetical protein [Flavobacteriaceae bacterium]
MEPSISTKSSFTLLLTMLLEGARLEIPDARCTFSYYWDPKISEGKAQLVGINGSMLAITLFSEMQERYIVFKSDMQPTKYSIKGVEVVIHSIVLHISLETEEKAAAITFNFNKSVIQTNEGYKGIME